MDAILKASLPKLREKLLEALQAVLTPLSAASLLVFCLLYTPCVAAIASIRRELGRKWAITVVVTQCVLAWLFAFLIRIPFLF